MLKSPIILTILFSTEGSVITLLVWSVNCDISDLGCRYAQQHNTFFEPLFCISIQMVSHSSVLMHRSVLFFEFKSDFNYITTPPALLLEGVEKNV